jgi:predicted DsbA family dithiol-disulfide isomerase
MEPLLSALKSGCARFVSVEHMSIAEPEVQQRAAQLGIWGVPTLVYINEQGQEKARIAGYKTGQELQHILHTASTSKQAVALKDCISWAAF